MTRIASIAASLVSALVGLVAAQTAVGLLSCFGDSCSYELRGYTTHGPGALYAVMGGAAALVVVLALAACGTGLRATIACGRLRPVLLSLALALGGMAAFAGALNVASA